MSLKLGSKFSVFEGDLYRDTGNIRRVFRSGYIGHKETLHGQSFNLANLKACLRAGKFTLHGSYPIYFIAGDGAAISYDAVKAEFKNYARSMYRFAQAAKGRPDITTPDDLQWQIVGCAVNWDDTTLYCGAFGNRIPSACEEKK